MKNNAVEKSVKNESKIITLQETKKGKKETKKGVRESYRNLSEDEKIIKRNITNIRSKYMSDVDRERRKEYIKYVCHKIAVC